LVVLSLIAAMAVTVIVAASISRAARPAGPAFRFRQLLLEADVTPGTDLSAVVG
jgi:hypothetical protein